MPRRLQEKPAFSIENALLALGQVLSHGENYDFIPQIQNCLGQCRHTETDVHTKPIDQTCGLILDSLCSDMVVFEPLIHISLHNTIVRSVYSI